MEIAKGIHHLKFQLRTDAVGSFNLLSGDRTGLVDSGTHPQVGATLRPYCSGINLDAKSISTIVNTHWHGDHMGGNAEIKELSGAIVMAHLLDVEFIENPVSSVQAFVARYGKYHPMYGRTLEEMSQGQPRGSKVDRVLEEGDVVEVGPYKLEVIHTAGHTPGSITLYNRDLRTAFAGDALQGQGQSNGLAYYIDLEPYLITLEKIARLDLDSLIVAHEYMPLKETVLKGPKIKQFLSICKETVDRYDNQILEAVHGAGGPLTAGQVTKGVLEKNNVSQMAVSSVACVLTHLERLTSQGELRRLPPGPDGDSAEDTWAKA